MSVFEITIQRKRDKAWPVVAEHLQPGSHLPRRIEGTFAYDQAKLFSQVEPRDYGTVLGEALFRDEVHDAFRQAQAESQGELHVLLYVEDNDLKGLRWERLCAELDLGWDLLALDQRTPFALHLPSPARRDFPPFGQRDLRALVVAASPAGPDEVKLEPFDAEAAARRVQAALGEIPCDLLPLATLDALCTQLTAQPYTLLHIVCHGRYSAKTRETLLYLANVEGGIDPVSDQVLLDRLGRLRRLPHLLFLSACETASAEAEEALGGLAQRLVRELGLPAVVAMTERISVDTAQALAEAFYRRLREHGYADRALVEAGAGLADRRDIAVPALYSRLGGWPLFSDVVKDRDLTAAEIAAGLKAVEALLPGRAPALAEELSALAAAVRGTLGADEQYFTELVRQERKQALDKVKALCEQVLDCQFDALAVGQQPPAYDGRCPFLGLYPFRAEDREFFFGRKELVEDLRDYLAGHNFLAVLGASGSGKSSLVLAGLVPALQAAEPGLGMAYLTPGSDPPAQLDAALAAVRGQPAVLVVDQFEELFTLSPARRDGQAVPETEQERRAIVEAEEKRQAFLDRLLALAAEMRTIITMRIDFVGDCVPYTDLSAAIKANQEWLAPMNSAELRSAMERQARAVGLEFEADLANTVLDEVQGEPGAMPLLQHALLELWKRRHGRWLKADEYRAIGGVKQAIAGTAEGVYKELPAADRDRLRDVMVRLTRLGEEAVRGEERRDTRRRVEQQDLVPAGEDSAATRALVQRLADARLVVTSANPATGGEEVEVAHEALIRHWPRLRTWLNEDRTGLRLRDGIGGAAKEWQAHGGDETYLVHRGGRLEDAELLAKGQRFALNELEEAYVDACVDLRDRERREKEEQQRRQLEAARELAKQQEARAQEQAASAARMHRRAVWIGVVGIVAVVLALLSMFLWRQAQDRAREASDNAATATANLAVAVTNEAKANAESTRAIANEAKANVASTRALANEAKANVASTRAVVNEAKANAESTRAISNAATAQANANIARARELAALSANQLDVRLDLGLLLGIEAFRQENLSETRQALFEAWIHKPQLSRFLQGHADWVESVAWSADERLASGSLDGTVIIWDLERGLPAQTLEGHAAWVRSVAWSADGRLASRDDDGTIIVWNLERGLPALTLEGYLGRSLAWSTDGLLAAGTRDGTVIVWDLSKAGLERGLSAQTLKGYIGSVSSVAWSADGRLASAFFDGTVIVWDLERGLPALTLEGYAEIWSVAWSRYGRLAAGTRDGTVIVWDLSKAGLERGLSALFLEGHSDVVFSVAWSAYERLASGSHDGTVIVWDLERGRQALTLEGHPGSVFSVAWSADGRLASGSEAGTVILWDLERGRQAQTLADHAGKVWSVAWSVDGRLASGSEDGTVIVWDLERGLPALTLKGHSYRVPSVAWSADGRLASGDADGMVIVWDLERGLPGLILLGYAGSVWSVAWSADGRLAAGTEDGTVIVWDFSETGLKRHLPDQTLKASSWVRSVAWSADGRLASASWDDKVIIWDLERGLPDQTLEVSDWLWSVAWSADGRLAAGTENGMVIVWDLERGLPALTLEGHSNLVRSVAWSADGRLASGAKDGEIIVWDLERGLPAQTLKGHTSSVYSVVWSDEVYSVAWSADGRLASASDSLIIKVWEMMPEEWIRQACQCAGRNLTRAEWALYFPGEDYRKTCDEWPDGW